MKTLKFLSLLIISYFSPIFSQQCKSFNEKSVQNIDFEQFSGEWYPLLTSGEAAYKNCSLIDFVQSLSPTSARTVNFTIQLGDEKIKDGQLEWIGNSQFVGIHESVITVLSIDYLHYMITYFCYTNPRSQSVTEWYTIYGRSRHELVDKYESTLTDIVESKVSLFPIEQKKCKARASHGVAFDENELDDLKHFDFKAEGPEIWDLMLYSKVQKPFDFSIVFKQYDIHRFMRFNGTELVTSGTQWLVKGTRWIEKIKNGKRVEAAYLYVDENHRIMYEFCHGVNKEGLYIVSRRGHSQNLDFYLKMLSKLKAQTLSKIQHLTKHLSFKIDDKYKVRTVLFNDSELAIPDFTKEEGHWELRMTTEQTELHDNSECSIIGRSLVCVRLHDSKLSMVIVNDKIEGSRVIMSQKSEGILCETSYLYLDEKYKLKYYYCPDTKEEKVRFLTRKNEPNQIDHYFKIMTRASKSGMKKIDGLLKKMRMIRS